MLCGQVETSHQGPPHFEEGNKWRDYGVSGSGD